MDNGTSNTLRTTTPTREQLRDLPALLSPEQSGNICGVSARTITNLCNNGTLKACRIGRLWRVNRDALLEYAGLA